MPRKIEMRAGINLEEMPAWKEAKTLTVAVYDLIHQGQLGRNLPLKEQLREASVTLMSRLADALDAEALEPPDDALSIATRATSEVQSCLHVARAMGYLSEEAFHALYDQVRRARASIAALMKRLRMIEPAEPAVPSSV
ncbi:MAG: four helix bundle protein [Candidatus Omnitrophica bacterium]|nr:four helix bundle protein [Candidatus Omnitrophota bacterium]